VDQVAAMRAFVRVVEAGTFTRASGLLDMPKPTITKLIQALEAHLQTKLLHRTTRRVTVTPDGAAYYERVVRLLADLDDLDGSMALSQGTPKGRLRIDVSASLALLVIIPALPDFHARYPDIQIDFGVTDRLVDLIGENVDCVVRGGELTDQSLIARRIGELDFIACAAPSYLDRYGEPRHPTDFENSHYVVAYFQAGSGRTFPLSFASNGERYDVSGRYIVSVNDSNAYVGAALAGLGAIQAPTFMVQHHIAAGALRRVLDGWTTDRMPLHVVYPPNAHLSNKLRVFVDWVADLFASHDLIRRRATPVS
jgi:LysR family transcriptional regulator, regulator for bpeEF and oprC